MATTLQFRRYDTANVANTTGANGELIIDSDKHVVVVQDGTTAGGFPLARAEAYTQANSARDQANTARNTANAAYAAANSANSDANTRVLRAGDTMTGNLNVAATIISQNIIPNLNVTYDLGTSTSRFKDLWLANSTIHLGEANLSSVGDEVQIAKLNVNVLSTASGINIASQAADSYSQANAAYSQSNTARTTANDAYTRANTARDDGHSAYAQANAAYNQANTAYGHANAAYGEANLKLNLAGGTVSGDLTVTGNLFLTGNATYINVATLKVNDSIIQLSTNSISDAVDIGFMGHYSPDGGTTNLHAGFIRHAADDVFYAIDGYGVEPTNNIIDVASANLAWIRAKVNASSLFIDGETAATQANLTIANDQANTARNTANSSYAQANGAYDQANRAYTQANGARDQANTAYGQANAAYGQANSAYAEANLKVNLSGGTITGNLTVTEQTKTNVLISTRTALSAPSINQFNGERIRLYDFEQAGHPNYAIGVEASHIWHGVDDIGPTLGFKWYGNTTLVGLLRTNSTFEVSNSVIAGGFFTTNGLDVTLQANNSREQANAARDQANTARGTANDAYGQANAAYNNANTRVLKAGDTMTGNLNVAAWLITQNVLPDVNNTYSIGSPTLRYKDLYVGGSTIYIGDTILSASGDEMRANVFNAAVSVLVSGVNVLDTANGAYGQANGAYAQANAAYARANALTIQEIYASNGNVINSVSNVNTIQFDNGAGFNVVDEANGIVSIQMNSTFKNWEMNGVPGLVASGLDTVNFIGQGIIIAANNNASPKSITFTSAALDAYAQSNGAYGQANGAYAQANGAYSQANGAYAQANGAYAQANGAYAQANLKVSLAGDTMTGNLNVAATIITQNIEPNLNVTYNLGTPTKRFKDLYLSNSTIYIGETVLSASGDEMRANTFNAAVSVLVGGVNVLDTANGAYAQANGAYGQANGAYAQANGAYAQANSARDVANGAYAQANGAYGQANGAYAQANIAYGQANAAYGQANSAYAEANLKLNLTGGTLSGDLTVAGNLTVTGSNTLINVANLSVNDSIILMANGQVGDAYDIGFVGHFDRGATNTHAGFIRKASLNEFYLFDNYEVEPTNNIIDINGQNFRLGNVRVNTINANSVLILGSAAATQANLTLAHNQANTAYGQANAAYTAANNAKVTVFANSGTANATTQTINFVNTSTVLVSVANTSGNANIEFSLVGTPYDQANAARLQANTARTTANDAYGQANGAYTAANNAKVTVFANSGAANATTQTINFVNTATVLVTVANTAGNANITMSLIGTPYDQANSARDQANTARTQANTAYDQANSAYGAANNRVLKAGDTMTGILVAAGIRNTKNTVDGTNANTSTGAANNINLDESNFFTRTLTASVAFTFRNAPASGNAQSFTLVIVQNATGGYTPSFTNTVYWAGASAPPATTAANARDVWQFTTFDGGTTYYGTLSIKNAG